MNAKLTTRNMRLVRRHTWRESSYGSQRKQWTLLDVGYDAKCGEISIRYRFAVLVLPLGNYQ